MNFVCPHILHYVITIILASQLHIPANKYAEPAVVNCKIKISHATLLNDLTVHSLYCNLNNVS